MRPAPHLILSPRWRSCHASPTRKAGNGHESRYCQSRNTSKFNKGHAFLLPPKGYNFKRFRPNGGELLKGFELKPIKDGLEITLVL